MRKNRADRYRNRIRPMAEKPEVISRLKLVAKKNFRYALSIYSSLVFTCILKHLIILCIAITLAAKFAVPVHAQVSGSNDLNLIFSGSNRIQMVTSNRTAPGSTLPASYLRWELLPVISLYQIPFSGSVLYTTEDVSVGTNASRFEFGLGLSTERLENSLRQRIGSRVAQLKAEIPGQDEVAGIQETVHEKQTQLQRLESIQQDFSQLPSHVDELQSMNLLSGLERTALRFPSLGIGSTYPRFTPFTMQGITVNGVAVEYQPGILYTGLNVGRIKNQTLPGNFFGTPADDKRSNLYAISLGLGRRLGNHLHLMGGFIEEELPGNEISDDLFSAAEPQRNVLMGVRYHVAVLNRQLELEGDAAGSFLTRSPDAPVTEDMFFDKLPIISSLLKPNASTSGDFASRTRVIYRNSTSGTRLQTETTYIGPGYTSLAAPLLQADRLKLEGMVEQQLFNRILSVGAQLRRERNNLNRFLDYTRTSNNFMFSLSATPDDLPFIRLQTQLGDQQNRDADNPTNRPGQADLPEYRYRNRMFSAMSGYSFYKGRFVSTTNTSLTIQSTDASFQGGDFTATTFTIGETIHFDRFGVSADYQRFQFIRDAESTIRHELSLSGSAVLFGSWTNEIGIRGTESQGMESVSGLFYRASIPAWIFGTLQVKAEWDSFRRTQVMEGAFTRSYLQLVLLRTW